MLKDEQVAQYLAPHKRESLKKEAFASFSESYQQLGIYIADIFYYREETKFREKFTSFGFADKLWETEEGKRLADLLFGEVQAPYVQRIWDDAYKYPYSSDWSRRPFRSPNYEDYRETQLKVLKWLCRLRNMGVGVLPIAEQFQYAVYKVASANFFAVVLSEDPDKYYALVDFQAFATAIDTLFPDGVTIDAKFSTLEGQPLTEATVGDDLHATETESPTQTIKVGKQQMNGSTLLNYARFRKDDEGDFGRTRRQQEVLTAVFQQVKDPTKLFTGSEALGKVFALTSTNVPYSFLLTNGLSMAGDSRNGVERLTIPENGDWVDTYDMYGGQGLLIDFEAYKERLQQMGLR